MKINLQTWIIIGLAVVIALLIWFWPQTGTSDREKELDKENTSLLYKIDSLANRNKAILIDVRKDSIVYLQEKKSFNAKLEAKNRELAQRRAQVVKSRAEVQALIDSVPRLQVFVADLDSVVSDLDSLNTLKDQRIEILEYMHGKLSINVGAITQNFEKALELERQRYANSQEIIALKDKELKKSKRKTKGAVILGVAAAVGALLIK